jgi:hypothetical protein
MLSPGYQFKKIPFNWIQHEILILSSVSHEAIIPYIYLLLFFIECKLPAYHLHDFNYLHSNHSGCSTALGLLRRFQVSTATSTANSILTIRKGLNNHVPFLSSFFK